MGNAILLFIVGASLAFSSSLALDTFEENKRLKEKLSKYESDNKEEEKEININV